MFSDFSWSSVVEDLLVKRENEDEGVAVAFTGRSDVSFESAMLLMYRTELCRKFGSF